MLMHAFMVAVWDLHWYGTTDTSGVFLFFFFDIVQGGLETLHRSDEFLL